MSWPPENKEGGGGSPSASGKGIALRLSANVDINSDPIGVVPFNSVLFNDGMTYDPVTQEIEITEAGKIMITASVGGQGLTAQSSLSALLFKNGVQFRQFSQNRGVAPYTVAPLSVIDKCVPGDYYQLYVTCSVTPTYTLRASDGMTGLELSYL